MRVDYRPEKRNRIVFGGLLVLLIWAPIPLGSNREWSSLWLSAGLQILLAIWLVSHAQRTSRLPRFFATVRIPLVAFCVWIAYVAAQLIALPYGLATYLSPGTTALYAALPEAIPKAYIPLTVDRAETASSVLRYVGYFCVFLLMLAVVTTPRRVRIVLMVMMGVGLAEALYGVMTNLSEQQGALLQPVYGASPVTGTYVNQNHFAGLMEMTIPATIGLILVSGLAKPSAIGGAVWLDRIVDFALRRSAFAAFGLIAMCSGLILSASRGGLAACILSFILIVGLGVVWRRRSNQAGRLLYGALVIIFLAVGWMGLGNFVEKLENVGLESNRAEIRSSTYAMIRSFPVFGTGAGTFRWVFPSYKTEELSAGFYEHAHNDYLELLAEQGIIGFLLGVVAIGSALVKQGVTYVKSRNSTIRGTLFATLMGTTALLIHGLVDFNLQIPANAVYFFALLGLGCAVSASSFVAGDGP